MSSLQRRQLRACRIIRSTPRSDASGAIRVSDAVARIRRVVVTDRETWPASAPHSARMLGVPSSSMPITSGSTRNALTGHTATTERWRRSRTGQDSGGGQADSRPG
jgi:hypothetical protein